MDIVAERAQVLELIRKSLICETSLLTPDVAEFQCTVVIPLIALSSGGACCRATCAYSGRCGGRPVVVKIAPETQSFVVDRQPFATSLALHTTGKERRLSFEVPAPESPLERGLGNDPRKLGIAFVSLAIKAKELDSGAVSHDASRIDHP